MKSNNATPDLVKRSYIEEIDLMRALAILGVLFVHATSNPTVTLGGHSSVYPFYLILNKFGKLGTPTFIFLSSVVLFYTYYHKVLNKGRIQRFYRQRLLYILMPYLVWSIAYYLMLLTNGFENLLHVAQFDWERFLLRDLLYGKAYAHLYFVIISIQFYLMFPLLLLLLKKWKGLVKYIFFLGLAAQWAFFFYNHYIWGFQYKGSLFFSYLSYYTLGAFVGIYYEQVTNWLKAKARRMSIIISIAWIGSGLFHVYVYYPAYVYDEWFNTKWYELAWNVYALISVVMLYYIVLFFKQKGPSWLITVLSKLGLASFGIYLIHPMLLYFWRQWGEPSEALQYHLFIAGGWTVALFGSWLIVGLVQRFIPGAWVIFGQWKNKKVKQKAV